MKGSRLPAAWQLLFRISLPINCYCLAWAHRRDHNMRQTLDHS
ncbi:hypothetical protein DAI22_06g151133 [Oryza sativa Japonica Group]|nr:hypothetical protein DAI22_06g151133 [Oryza sativa Japonica Group]